MRFFNIICASTSYRQLTNPRVLINEFQKLAFKTSSKSKEIEKILATIPEKPKKPITLYLRFLRLAEPQILKEFPHASRTEIMKAAAAMYRKADEDILVKLKKEYEKDAERYHEAIDDYNLKLTYEQKDALQELKYIKKVKKFRSELKKKRIELGMPSKPQNAYMLFVNSNRTAEDKNIINYMKNISEKWQNLSEDEKKIFEQKSHELKNKYKTELAKWEAEMIELGHTDVIFKNSNLKSDVEQPKKSKLKKVSDSKKSEQNAKTKESDSAKPKLSEKKKTYNSKKSSDENETLSLESDRFPITDEKAPNSSLNFSKIPSKNDFKSFSGSTKFHLSSNNKTIIIGVTFSVVVLLPLIYFLY